MLVLITHCRIYLKFNNKQYMHNYLKKITPLAFAVIIFSSCSESKPDQKELAQINTMDSTSQAAKETADKMAAQTSKVEASLEKLDAEFKANN
jgi:high-affinity K+ transport system ATPase subunit B